MTGPDTPFNAVWTAIAPKPTPAFLTGRAPILASRAYSS